jgi:hypothetical protein
LTARGALTLTGGTLGDVTITGATGNGTALTGLTITGNDISLGQHWRRGGRGQWRDQRHRGRRRRPGRRARSR